MHNASAAGNHSKSRPTLQRLQTFIKATGPHLAKRHVPQIRVPEEVHARQVPRQYIQYSNRNEYAIQPVLLVV